MTSTCGGSCPTGVGPGRVRITDSLLGAMQSPLRNRAARHGYPGMSSLSLLRPGGTDL